MKSIKVLGLMAIIALSTALTGCGGSMDGKVVIVEFDPRVVDADGSGHVYGVERQHIKALSQYRTAQNQPLTDYRMWATSVPMSGSASQFGPKHWPALFDKQMEGWEETGKIPGVEVELYEKLTAKLTEEIHEWLVTIDPERPLSTDMTFSEEAHALQQEYADALAMHVSQYFEKLAPVGVEADEGVAVTFEGVDSDAEIIVVWADVNVELDDSEDMRVRVADGLNFTDEVLKWVEDGLIEWSVSSYSFEDAQEVAKGQANLDSPAFIYALSDAALRVSD